MCTMQIHEVPTYAHWPSSHPSMVGAPLCAHHTPPINLWQYSTLHPHPCTRSEPGCTATFGCACPTMFPIAWRNFHHKPALVASVILWLEYLLSVHLCTSSFLGLSPLSDFPLTTVLVNAPPLNRDMPPNCRLLRNWKLLQGKR